MGISAAEATTAAEQPGQIEVDTVVDAECHCVCKAGVWEASAGYGILTSSMMANKWQDRVGICHR